MRDRRSIERSALPGAEERSLLRDSLRGLLKSHWPAQHAVAQGADQEALDGLWSLLVEQGCAGLGQEPGEGGLRELVVLMEELGRAAAPVPMLAAALTNLALAGSERAAAAAWLDQVQSGTVRPCWSFGGFDADAGNLEWQEGLVSGTLRFVEGASAATHLVVATEAGSGGLAFIALAGEGNRASSAPGLATGPDRSADRGAIPASAETRPRAAGGDPDAARPDDRSGADAARVVVVPTRALGSEGWAEVRLAGARAAFMPLEGSVVTDLLRIARLALLARAHGASRRAFEMAVNHAKERRQFGQPIGRFQAIQHKLADGLIALEGVRLTLEHAAESFDFGVADWRYFAAAAVAFGAPALRRVGLETHHALGAIGYAEEHEAPRHFKRSHLDAIALGGAAAAQRELATHLLDRPDGRPPEYDLGPAGNAFRAEVREWLKAHWSGARKAEFDSRPFEEREFDSSFARDLGETGWIGLGWPRQFGGQARSPLEQLAFMEVMERAEAPRAGASVQANALMMHGTAAQQARWLPEILRGEVMHGMGYSEPDAGSDLAALRTSAVRVEDGQGDHWLINGQKIWTTTWWGQYMFLAARTDREARPPHAGISMFVVPMSTPGISIRPATTMYDGSFANIFYDNVRVPADALVGAVNGGWKVLTDALANERGWVGGGIVLKVMHAFELLCQDVRGVPGGPPPRRDDAVVRDRMAVLAAEIEVGRRLMIYCAELASAGTTPPEYGAMSKVFSGELMERLGEVALDILGPRAALSQGAAGSLRAGRYEQGLRHSLMWVISIGTNEIQRSLIAQRGLGLPR